MPTTESTELNYLTGYKIFPEPHMEGPPVLQLSTEVGDYHFLVTKENLLKLASAFQKYADDIPEKS